MNSGNLARPEKLTGKTNDIYRLYLASLASLDPRRFLGILGFVLMGQPIVRIHETS